MGSLTFLTFGLLFSIFAFPICIAIVGNSSAHLKDFSLLSILWKDEEIQLGKTIEHLANNHAIAVSISFQPDISQPFYAANNLPRTLQMFILDESGSNLFIAPFPQSYHLERFYDRV